jgi:hypothetical protein
LIKKKAVARNIKGIRSLHACIKARKKTPDSIGFGQNKPIFLQHKRQNIQADLVQPWYGLGTDLVYLGKSV